MKYKLGALVVAIGTCALSVVLAPAAQAIPANCESIPWGFLGSKERDICDDPIRPDGSWMRHRVIGVAAHYVNPSSSCSSGTYYSNCTYYPGGWVDDRIDSNDWYPVFPDAVPGGEPGHLP